MEVTEKIKIELSSNPVIPFVVHGFVSYLRIHCQTQGQEDDDVLHFYNFSTA